MTRKFLVACLILAAPARTASSQATPDTLRLSDLRAAALANDPRNAQARLLAAQSALRIRNIGTELLPALSIEALGQYQSDVVSVPVELPGVSLPVPTRDSYDAKIDAQQRIYDPSIAPRRAVERAELAESQSRLRSELYALNEAVNVAYFAALRAESQSSEIATAITDLEAQLSVTDARVAARAALPSESDALRAEILRRRQATAEQASVRRAAIATLAGLTGREIGPAAILSLPVLSVESTGQTLRARPEYEQFARTREVLEQREKMAAAREKPRLGAFGRVGYGRPGLNPLTASFDTYWITGVQLQWSPWAWGAPDREREIVALQRQIVTTQEEAFAAAIRRATDQDIAAIRRLESTLLQDDEIVAIRERILAETRLRFEESVITSAEYVDRQTDVLSARLARALHRVDLAHAQARFLTTLGMEIR